MCVFLKHLGYPPKLDTATLFWASVCRRASKGEDAMEIFRLQNGSIPPQKASLRRGNFRMRHISALSFHLIRRKAVPAFFISPHYHAPDRSPAVPHPPFQPRSNRARRRQEEGDARGPFPPPWSRRGDNDHEGGTGSAPTILLSEGKRSPGRKEETRQARRGDGEKTYVQHGADGQESSPLSPCRRIRTRRSSSSHRHL
jgi:hypothetical protein